MKIADYFGSNLVVLVLNAATLLALSATLSLPSFAMIAVFQSILFIAIPLQSFQSAPLNATLVAKGEYSEGFQASQQIVSFSMFGAMASISIGLWVVSVMETQITLLVLASIGVGYLRSLYTYHDNYLIQTGESAQYRNWRILNAALVFMFSVGLALFWDSGWARVLGVLSGELLVFAFRAPKFIVRLSKFDKREVKRILRFGAPLLPVALLSWVNFQSDRYVLSTFFERDLAGFYAIVFWSLAILNSFFASLKSIYVPGFRQMVADGYRFSDAIWKTKAYFVWSLLVSVVAVFGIFYLLPFFVEFHDDGFLWNLLLLVFGLMFFNLGIFGTSMVEMAERSIFRFWVVFLSALVHAPFLALAIHQRVSEFLFCGYFLGFFVQFVGFTVAGRWFSTRGEVR
jgi:O-antigen/teichoic acid export membrane protein